jgi:CRP-like cAMP-binding protein
MQTTNSPLEPLVRKLGRWEHLAAADKTAILSLPYNRRTFAPGGYIVRERDEAHYSCVLLSGFAYRQKVVAKGARQILSIHISGDMVDLQNAVLNIADHSVQALTDLEVAMISRDAIRELTLSHPAVGLSLWYDTLVDGSIFREWVANVGRRDALTRVAHLLCEFCVRLRSAGLCEGLAFNLPMTQEQLADCTGLTSVHVNRTLKELERRGLILRDLRSVTIPDWHALIRAGDFNETYLHMSQSAASAESERGERRKH